MCFDHVTYLSLLMLQTDKCPLCYGQSLCEDLKSGHATLQYLSRFQFLNGMSNMKNVNFGQYRGNAVVFKKLAHNKELTEFDAEYGRDATFPGVDHTKNVHISEVKGNHSSDNIL